MSRRIVVLMALAAILALTATPALALCSQQYHSWYPYTWINLLLNSNFEEQSQCPAWAGPAPVTTWECGMPLAPRQDKMVVLDALGGYYGGETLSQSFSVPTVGGNPVDMKLTAFVTATGNPTSWDVLKFKLVDTDTGSSVWSSHLRVDTATWICKRATFNIGGNLSGKNLRLEVYGQIFTEGVEFHLIAVDLDLYL